ncbi:uncharacterized protein TNCV_1138421 [Trichonephila clavipes]|nr:uncharacterized protein TNCV_1138421 [Trichonephila clavipes]
MCSNLTTQHIEDLKLVSALPIAVDESCDINDTSQVSLFVRFMSHLSPKEELLGLLPLKGQTRGEDIAIAVIECMDKHHIPLYKIMSISIDEAKKALCAQTFPDEICKVMELVITIINSILAKALNYRQFREFLFEMESEYADLLLHNKEGTTDRRGRSQPPQCTTSREDRQTVRMAVTNRSVTSRTVVQHIESVTHHSVSARTIRRSLQQSALSA